MREASKLRNAEHFVLKVERLYCCIKEMDITMLLFYGKYSTAESQAEQHLISHLPLVPLHSTSKPINSDQ